MVIFYRIFVCIMLVLIYFKLSILNIIDENLQIVRAFETENVDNAKELSSIATTIDEIDSRTIDIAQKLKIK